MNRIRTAARQLAGPLDDRDDPELLDRFIRYAEHAAFETLVRRHGGLVWGVCRRILGQHADAEDAFQAVFLVLVRKAAAVGDRHRLGPWLYGVAYRVALKAKGKRRPAVPLEADMTPTDDPDPAADWVPILDRELAALPAKYREPIVLCELEGLSRKAAAAKLRLAEGTLSSRLARGRELLRTRLLRHGTLLPAGGVAALVGQPAAVGGLVAKTAERLAAGAVPAGAAALADEVVKAMFVSKLRVVGVGLLAGLLAAGGAEEKKQELAKADAAKPAAVTPAGPDEQAIQGLWRMERRDIPASFPADARKSIEQAEQHNPSRLLIRDGVMWSMSAPSDGTWGPITTSVYSLQPGKRPKWIDMTAWYPGTIREQQPPWTVKSIYELNGDRLVMCSTNNSGPRPAEFTEEKAADLWRMVFVREPLPPAAGGDPKLVGSWVGDVFNGHGKPRAFARVEVFADYIFCCVNPEGGITNWYGGTYQTDGTRNPKWIDVRLTAPANGVTTYHGSYDVADDTLSLVLSRRGIRALRPLDLKDTVLNPTTEIEFKLKRSKLTPAEEVSKQLRREAEPGKK